MATLLIGLEDCSRTIKKLTNRKGGQSDLLSALIFDSINSLARVLCGSSENTKSLYEYMIGKDTIQTDYVTFNDSQSFEDAWSKITKGG